MNERATGKVKNNPRSLFEKVWDQHVVLAREQGPSLLYIDRHLIHEGSFHAFNQLRERGLAIRNVKQIFGIADHYVPTTSRHAAGSATPEIEEMIVRFDQNMRWSGVPHFGLSDPNQGIVHVIGPELGLTQPGVRHHGVGRAQVNADDVLAHPVGVQDCPRTSNSTFQRSLPWAATAVNSSVPVSVAMALSVTCTTSPTWRPSVGNVA